MIVFLLLISFLAILLGYAKDKKFTSPIVMFSFLWAFITTLAVFPLRPINEVSDNMLGIIIVGVFFFFLGSIIVPRKINSSGAVIYNNDKIYSYLKYLQILGIIIFLIADIPALILLREGATMEDLYQMRMSMAHGGETELSGASHFLTILLEYIARPVLAISIPYTVLDVLLYKRFRNIIICITLLVLGYISKANRMDIILAFVSFLYAYLVFKKSTKFSIVKTWRLSIYLVLVLVLFVFLSSLRSSKEMNMFDTFYFYLCGNIPLAEVKIAKLGIDHIYTYGMTSFQGLIRPFAQFFEIFQIGSSQLFDLADKYADVEEAEYIGGYGLYNAFVGPFYFFYCDLGYIGVAIYSALFGFCVEKLYYKALSQKDFLVNVLFVMIVVRGVLFSFYNFLFAGIPYGVALFILILFRFLKNKKYDLRKLSYSPIHRRANSCSSVVQATK